MRRTFALSLLLALLVTCASKGDDVPEPATGRIPVEHVTGVITGITIDSSEIDSITITHGADETQVFIKHDYDYGFNLGHLYSHKLKKLPVRVTFEREDGTPFAISIDDV
jgi:hypothetical protein